MENPIKEIVKLVCTYFIECDRDELNSNARKITLVRVHNEKLKSIGDVSFPIEMKIWQIYFNQSSSCTKRDCFEIFLKTERSENALKEFLEVSSKWTYPVQQLSIQNGRCLLFLNRHIVTAYLLRSVLINSEVVYGNLKKNSRKRVLLCGNEDVSDDTSKINNLTLYRAKLIKETLHRVLQYSEWIVQNEIDHLPNEYADAIQLKVLSIMSKEVQEKQSNMVYIKCGIVTDPKNDKVVSMDTNSYHSLRSNDMRLMAMHKYGIRVQNDVRFCALIERLGVAAVTVDLLEVKHSSPVQIIRNGQGSTKGASFILYNSARLETLLRTFDKRVQTSVYNQLPHIDHVDLTLLNEEEEWQLIFGYIFAFPDLIERCIEQLERGICSLHLIVRYLSGLVAIFSVYYRRIRILTETRNHLMPYVYARIYLIKAVREILNKTLALLDIQPESFI